MTRVDPGAPSRTELAVLAGAVVVGLSLRLLWLRDAAELPLFTLPQTDDYVYARGAARIAGGDFWLAGQPLRFGPPYFYLLALVDAVAGPSPFAPRILQIAVGLAVIPTVWWTARVVTASVRASLLAASIAALYGPAIFFESLLLPEAAMTLVHALLALAVVHALGRPDARPWLAVGGLAGLAIAFRPNAVLLLMPLALAAAHRGDTPGGRELRASALFGSTALGLLPLMLRNLVATGAPFSASTAGINAFIGNGPGATGVFRVPSEVPEASSASGQFGGFRAAASRALGHAVDDDGADRYWLGRTIDHVLAHPLEALAVLARKIHLFWNARELSNVVDYDFLRTLRHAFPFVQFAWIAPLGLAGMLLLLAPRRTPVERSIAGLLLAGSLSVILVFVQDRYRVPFVPWVIVCAVAAGETLIERARERRWRALAFASAPLALGLALTLPPIGIRPHPERQWTALGDGYRALGRDEEACAAFSQALAADPTFAPASDGARATCGD